MNPIRTPNPRVLPTFSRGRRSTRAGRAYARKPLRSRVGGAFDVFPSVPPAAAPPRGGLAANIGRVCGLAAVIGAGCAAAQSAYAQGTEGEEPEREITQLTGDLYRFRQVRHIGMFLVTAEGIIVVDPTNSALAGWLKEQLDERFGLPVKYVIYSHSHNDHASERRGLCGYRDLHRSREHEKEPPTPAGGRAAAAARTALGHERRWTRAGNRSRGHVHRR